LIIIAAARLLCLASLPVCNREAADKYVARRLYDLAPIIRAPDNLNICSSLDLSYNFAARL
jgi:hypothetical protein